LSFICLYILLPLFLSFSFYLSAFLKSQSVQLRNPYSRANIFDIKYNTNRFSRVHPAIAATAAAAAAAAATGATGAGPARPTKAPAPVEEVETAADTDVPWKLVAVSSRMQFTCGLKELSMSGRADFKAIKTVIR
jgi:hypothetical protein